jgi:hypothetical protein
VIEHSFNSKTRGIAIRELQLCVESSGLNAVGKKGMLVTAKGFSEESMPENKALYLELIETIILKMNGDMNKFFKVCGSSALSRRSKDTIATRMAKSGTGTDLSQNASLRQSSGSSTTRSRTPLTQTMSRTTPSEDNEGPFKFSYGSNGTKSSGESVESRASLSDDILNKREASSGAAASLRERLRQIRDKHVQEGDSSSELPTNGQSSRAVAAPTSCPLYNEIMESVEIVLGEPTPLLEINEIFTKALICLRQLHSSLSNSNNDSTGTDPALLKELRQYIHYKVPEVVKLLTRYVLNF